MAARCCLNGWIREFRAKLFDVGGDQHRLSGVLIHETGRLAPVAVAFHGSQVDRPRARVANVGREELDEPPLGPVAGRVDGRRHADLVQHGRKNLTPVGNGGLIGHLNRKEETGARKRRFVMPIEVSSFVPKVCWTKRGTPCFVITCDVFLSKLQHAQLSMTCQAPRRSWT